MMYGTWCLLFPIGVLTRIGRGIYCFNSPTIVTTHSIVQAVGFLLVTIAFGIGLKMGSSQGSYHGIFGIVTFSVIAVQTLAGVLTYFVSLPQNSHLLETRKIVSIFHNLVGISIFPLAWLTIFLGISELRLPISYLYGHGAIVVFWLTFYVGLQLFLKHVNTKVEVPSNRWARDTDL
eukprot:TRINITY_DN6931_c0_g1_i3.p1 TRINITY_DN6931_c0_g1~~TRINITY_DN6931_c0_g1_i3.p1  ORF type:complete len:177 (-),score=12.23 TRINITY_DN6931_c0_g1_i3:176-706(-)